MDNKISSLHITNNKVLSGIFKNYQLYLYLLPTLVWLLLFQYMPMYGVTIAFKEFSSVKGILGSPWVGFVHFSRFLTSYNFWLLIWNTLTLSLYGLIAGFPIPILFALLLNHLKNQRFKKIVQTVVYAPHFISTVVLVGMLFIFLAPQNGIINILIGALGGTSTNFMGSEYWFKHVYVLSGIWQSTGWASIIYLATLAGISQELHEAAVVDGANKLQRIWNIDLPGIMPTAVIMLILNAGRIMSVGFEKAFLMQTPLNSMASEILSTYVYKIGLLGAQFSFSAAVGLFNAVINFALLIIVNRMAKRFSEVSLW